MICILLITATLIAADYQRINNPSTLLSSFKAAIDIKSMSSEFNWPLLKSNVKRTPGCGCPQKQFLACWCFFLTLLDDPLHRIQLTGYLQMRHFVQNNKGWQQCVSREVYSLKFVLPIFWTVVKQRTQKFWYSVNTLPDPSKLFRNLNS